MLSDRRQKLAAGSIVIALGVLGLKAFAWAATGSVALLSDALESIVNVVTAVVALAALRLAARPADADHPYGHTKAEYFAAVLVGVLIVVAAGLIFMGAAEAFRDPRPLSDVTVGLGFSVAATIVNGAWAAILLREGRRLRSLALGADGRHLLADVVSSLGVIVGVAAVAATGIVWLDPLVAALVGVNVLWSGWLLVRESVDGLMDTAVAPEMQARLREVISANAAGAIEAHDLRTRHAGRVIFLDFHLVVAGSLPVSDAHDICDRIERAIRAEFGDAQITIHVEPDNKAKHSGIVVL